MTPEIWDMHVHLDFMSNAREIVNEAAAIGLGMFAATVTPQGYELLRKEVPETENLRIAAGLHPWWAADGRCSVDDMQRTAAYAGQTRFIGEIGIDASPKHVPEGSLEIQTKMFESVCTACAHTSSQTGPKILSLHAVKAAGRVLDILERTGCLSSCRCIFHWFTGSGDELNRAVKAGCFFSVNEMMLGTRRGREYVRQLPAKQLLTETDLPPGRDIPYSAEKIAASLERTLEELRGIRGKDMKALIRENSEKVLNL